MEFDPIVSSFLGSQGRIAVEFDDVFDLFGVHFPAVLSGGFCSNHRRSHGLDLFEEWSQGFGAGVGKLGLDKGPFRMDGVDQFLVAGNLFVAVEP